MKPVRKTTLKWKRFVALVVLPFQLIIYHVRQGFTAVAREVKNRLLADGPQRGGGNVVKPVKPGAAKPAGGKGCC